MDKTTGNIVITGASTGIGATTALRLDSLGYRVFAGVRKESDAQTLRDKASPRLTPIHLDVTDPAQIATAARHVASEVGETGLAGLINNAGIAVAGPLEFLPIEQFRNQLEINVVGLVAVTQAFLPLVRLARGRIVNIGSISGERTTPFVGAYAASKHAVEAVSDAFRMELRPWGIEVVLLRPGAIATPIWEKSRLRVEGLDGKLPEQYLEYYGQGVRGLSATVRKIDRIASPPEKVANAVVRALTARRPSTRRLIGVDAYIQAFIVRYLPNRWSDAILLWIAGVR